MINTAMGITSCLITLLINYTFLKCVLKKKAEKPLDYLLLFGLFVINSLSAFFLDENLFLKLISIMSLKSLKKLSVKKANQKIWLKKLPWVS